MKLRATLLKRDQILRDIFEEFEFKIGNSSNRGELQPPSFNLLTEREKQVYKNLISGKTRKEIASASKSSQVKEKRSISFLR